MLEFFELFKWNKNKKDEPAVLDGSKAEATQHSIVTIFSIWNAMMGTSLLAMPWAIKQAGFANGILLLLGMAGVMGYTAYRVLTSSKDISGSENASSDFSDVVRFYLGRPTEIATFFCSMTIYLGASIVYWIIMSSSLYHIVIFIYEHSHTESLNETLADSHYENAICQSDVDVSADFPDGFKSAWDKTNTVPLYLIVVVFPIISIKSPTFFTKFTAIIGAIHVTYVLVFISVKAAIWGFHLSFENPSSSDFTQNFSSCFPALTGIASMAFFFHNSIIPVMNLQKHPEHNIRDLVIAFSLVCGTYLFIGLVFFASFPLDKSCIGDNLLENMTSVDIMSFVARIGIFLQMMCVYPLIVYMLRSQLLQFFFNAPWPSLKHVLVLNTIVVASCVLFAVFLPTIGHIISFVGAFCGLSYAIMVPCLVYLVSSHRQGTLTRLKLGFHCLLITVGVANFIAQFLIIGQTS